MQSENGNTRLRGVYLVCAEVSSLRRFYEAIFDIPLRFADGERWIQYSPAPAHFALASKEEAPSGSGGAILVFEVSDIEHYVNKAIAAGAVQHSRRDMGNHGRTATFSDPEGNLFQLFCK